MPGKNEAEEALAKVKEKEVNQTAPTQGRSPDQSVGKNKLTIKMIIKTDTVGSLEALEKELMKLKDEEVALRLLKGGVGNINEDDARFSSGRLMNGQASNKTVILGFNVATDHSTKE